MSRYHLKITILLALFFWTSSIEAQEYNFISQLKTCKEIYIAENIETPDPGNVMNMYGPGIYQESTFKVFASIINPSHEKEIILSHLDNYGHDLGWMMFFKQGQEYLLCTHEQTAINSTDIQHGFLSVHKIDSTKIKLTENFIRSLMLSRDTTDLRNIVLEYIPLGLETMTYVLSDLSIEKAQHSSFKLTDIEKEIFYQAFQEYKDHELIPFIRPHRKMEIDSILMALIEAEVQEIRQQRKAHHPYIDALLLLDAYILNGNEFYEDCTRDLWSSNAMSVSNSTKGSRILLEVSHIIEDHKTVNK